jgi:hypothetical protein
MVVALSVVIVPVNSDSLLSTLSRLVRALIFTIDFLCLVVLVYICHLRGSPVITEHKVLIGCPLALLLLEGGSILG